MSSREKKTRPPSPGVWKGETTMETACRDVASPVLMEGCKCNFAVSSLVSATFTKNIGGGGGRGGGGGGEDKKHFPDTLLSFPFSLTHRHSVIFPLLFCTFSKIFCYNYQFSNQCNSCISVFSYRSYPIKVLPTAKTISRLGFNNLPNVWCFGGECSPSPHTHPSDAPDVLDYIIFRLDWVIIRWSCDGNESNDLQSFSILREVKDMFITGHFSGTYELVIMWKDFLLECMED